MQLSKKEKENNLVLFNTGTGSPYENQSMYKINTFYIYVRFTIFKEESKPVNKISSQLTYNLLLYN